MSDNKKRDWRELAAMVSAETDPAKLPALIAELTEALDEYQKEVTLNAAGNNGGATQRQRNNRAVVSKAGDHQDAQ
jgi:hypothetical protein